MAYQKLKSERYANVKGINRKKSFYVTGDNEVLDLVNYDFSEIGAWTQRWGTTGGLVGNTLVIGSSHRINNFWQVESATGINSVFVSTDYTLLRYDTTNSLYSNTFQGFSGSLQTFNGFSNSPVNVQSTVFFTNSYFTSMNAGGEFYKSNGFQIGYFGLPTVPFSGITTAGAGGLTGNYNFQVAYTDQTGFIGPISSTFAVTGLSANSIRLLGVTVSATDMLYTPTGYVIYRDRVLNNTSTEMLSVGEYPLNGITLIYDGSLQTGWQNESPNDSDQFTLIPDFLETYNSVMWLGFASNNSVQYSEVNDAENILPENIDFYINDKFKMTGLKYYNQSLLVFLQKGVFRVTGNNAASLNPQLLTKEYGTISNKAICVWKERCRFLDEDGICEFDGSNFKYVSEPVEFYLKRINQEAALQRACAYHYTERKEVWFCIPIDGAENNNLALVYDYDVDGWTTFRGFIPTYLNDIYIDSNNDGFLEKRVYHGSLGATFNYFDQSFGTDAGQAITLSFTTKYHNELGKSRTAQFRRLYLDTGAHGSTMNYNVNMYANYSTSAISLTRSFPIGPSQGLSQPFGNQNRIDFGVPAKSLSFEVSTSVTTTGNKIQGYTVEYRYQRDV